MSNFPLQANETYYRRIVVRDADGDPVAADALPVGTVYRNGTAVAAPVTITQLVGPAEYAVSFVLPGDTLISDTWQLFFTAAVSGQLVERWVQLTQALFLNSAVARGFTVRAASGLAAPADSLPTGTVIRNNATELTSVTVSAVGSPADGKYLLSFVIDAAWTLGDEIQVQLSATVGGITAQRLWYMGQVIDASDLTVTVTNLIVVDEEKSINLLDEEQPITMVCEP